MVRSIRVSWHRKEKLLRSPGTPQECSNVPSSPNITSSKTIDVIPTGAFPFQSFC